MVMIDSPFHGAVLNHRHGCQTAECLRIEVRGRAPLLQPVTVNGIVAERTGEQFRVEIDLRQAETDIAAVSTGPRGESEHHVRVVWDRYSRPRYRFGIDDNSFFLRDIAQHGYASIFDCFYLGLLRDLHRKYGTKMVLNIYFTTGDDFTLTQFPETYKGEWRDCSDWLKLTFHAYANEPNRPYQHATAHQLATEFDAVAEQILRFAGPDTYVPPTIIHWGMVPRGAFRALTDRDVKVLSGYFSHRPEYPMFDVNYWIDDERSEYLSRHDALKDFESGIVFTRVDLICNGTPLPNIVPTLEALRDNPDTAEVMDLMTHEQYFWPFYSNYIPDHAERLDTAFRWVTDNGYEPVLFDQGFLGGREPT